MNNSLAMNSLEMNISQLYIWPFKALSFLIRHSKQQKASHWHLSC